MPSIRVVAADSVELVELHLIRMGLDACEAQRLARRRGGLQLLVTGADRDSLLALRRLEGLPPIAFGDPERAPGTALLSARHEEIDALIGRLADSGGGLTGIARSLTTALARHSGYPASMHIGGRAFEWGKRTYLMGILNVTPDSFSDGGKHAAPEMAITAGERLAAEGADLIDIGGESTRPGALPVSAEQEMERVLPVVERLAKLVEVPLSVDTTKAQVAEAAVRAGASVVNDISGLMFDPEMAPTCARLGVSVCVMHIRGTPRTMQQSPSYLDIVGEVIEGLKASLDHAERCGVPPERVIVDPGIGFGKTADHNLFLLRNLGQLKTLGRPILAGASRKSFIGAVTGRAVGDRLSGSLAALAAAVLGGADLVRVHDVAESRAAAQFVDAMALARAGGLAFGQGP